jgi:formate hydrogenlyase subunit 4
MGKLMALLLWKHMLEMFIFIYLLKKIYIKWKGSG